jgi:hypothetical protein
MLRYFGDSHEKEFSARGRNALFLAAFAAGCGMTSNSGNGADGGNASTGDATASSSGTSSGGGAGGSGSGSSSGASSGGLSSGGSSTSSSSGSAVADSGNSDDSAGGEGVPEAGPNSGSAGGCAGKPYKLCEDFDEPGTMVGAIPTGWQLRPASGGAGGVGMVGLANDQAFRHHVAEERLVKNESGPRQEESHDAWSYRDEALGTDFLQGRYSGTQAE